MGSVLLTFIAQLRHFFFSVCLFAEGRIFMNATRADHMSERLPAGLGLTMNGSGLGHPLQHVRGGMQVSGIHDTCQKLFDSCCE